MGGDGRRGARRGGGGEKWLKRLEAFRKGGEGEESEREWRESGERMREREEREEI